MEEITLLDPQPKAADTYLPTAAKPAPVAVVTAAVATMEEATLAHFAEMRTTVMTLAERYRAVAYDVMTPRGMNDAKAARHALREEGRYAVQRVETAVKRKANDLKGIVSDTAAELVAIIKPIEDAIDKQIEAREEFLKAEKERLATIERQRKEAHELHIAKIRGYLAQAVGRSSDVILSGIQVLEARAFPASEWEEYAETAAAARDQVCVTLREMAATAQRAEAEAAELARVKAEQARIAEEQRVERERLAAEADTARKAFEAERAELARQQAELAAERQRLADAKAVVDAAAQDAIDAIERDLAAEDAGRSAEERRLEAACDSLDSIASRASRGDYDVDEYDAAVEELHAAEQAVADAANTPEGKAEWRKLPAQAFDAAQQLIGEGVITSVSLDDATNAEPACIPIVGVIQDEAEAEPIAEVPPAPPINLSTIADRLGWRLDREFIEVTLGITSSHREKSAIFWPATAWPAICAGLIEHIKSLPGAAEEAVS